MNTAPVEPPPVEPPPVEHGFFRWIRGLGVQRSQERWIGGVAAGLGQRFGIDPLLARGLVVVLAVFTGSGLLLYGLAWALLPEPDGRIHLQEAGRGRWTAGMTGALAAFLLGLADFPTPFGHWNGGWWPGTLWTLLVVGGIIWFVASRQRPRGGAPAPGSPNPAPAPAPAPAWEGTAPPRSTGFTTGTTPEGRTPAKHPRPQPSLPGHTVAVVVGVAVLVAGTLALLNLLNMVSLDGIVVPVALAAALVVLGLGLVAAALRHTTGGALTGLTIALLVCTVLASGAALNTSQWRWGSPISERNGNSYTNVFASSTVDLTGYSTVSTDTTVRMDGAFSSLEVLVPDNIPVVVTSDGAFYSMEVATDTGRQTQSGIGRSGDVLLNQDAAGPTLTVEIDGAFNNISVETAEAQVIP
ncbi:hypothetical protein NCCP1664_00630 [Zafaria cholistanensis]|uniref:Phage shock protein PspC N-terminal domain-containing protein n=1 Tax=Zafaria cholistanensis TaxID=1682741 RepID=A0A5A7NM31_9MICC|nr:PspC domain-containing protein [Zafaria cholistanensis]GER21566.1 hypothetical protein NCCP1664_00630 [Zafaria cholistanensis]